jgi:hypothetical protein
VVLWAWERPEDLRFIDPTTTGVAYLAATAFIQPDGAIRYHFRQQPLATPPNAARIAVVRIESPPRYIFPPVGPLTQVLAGIAAQPGVIALQIDFDARGSEHPFYMALLEALRKSTPLPIGITTLASWCEGGTWLPSGLVSEAVPMFFRMGRNESKSMPVTAPICRNSLGVSTDESWPARRPGRIYIFNPKPWTEAEYELAIKRLGQNP